MKLTNPNEFLLTNVESSNAFTIEANSKMFQILSSSIYTDKIKAVIRELSCNAVDSHIAAGKADVPIEVHLPTRLSPTFEVQDYGLGLSHEDINNIYTTYGASLKNESNDMIGGLGLGSKSPFAYSDSFNVEAVKDGEKNIYTMYIGSNGEPTYSRLSTHATSEPNGVKVIVPVQEDQFWEFEHKASLVFQVFDVVPKLNKDLYISSLKDEWFDNHTDYNIEYYNGGSDRTEIEVNVIMGQIHYKVNIDNAFLYENLDKHDKFFQTIVRSVSKTFLQFDIGELDIHVSRETLTLSPYTLDALRTKIIDCVNNEYQLIKNHIDANCQTRHEAIDFLNSMLDINRYNLEREYHWSSIEVPYYYFNQEIFHTLEMVNLVDDPDDKVTLHFLRPHYSKRSYMGASETLPKLLSFKQICFIEGVDKATSAIYQYVKRQRQFSDRSTYIMVEELTNEAKELLEFYMGSNVSIINIKDVRASNRIANKSSKVDDDPTVFKAVCAINSGNGWSSKKELIKTNDYDTYEDVAYVLGNASEDDSLVKHSEDLFVLRKLLGLRHIIRIPKNDKKKVEKLGIRHLNDILLLGDKSELLTAMATTLFKELTDWSSDAFNAVDFVLPRGCNTLTSIDKLRLIAKIPAYKKKYKALKLFASMTSEDANTIRYKSGTVLMLLTKDLKDLFTNNQTYDTIVSVYDQLKSTDTYENDYPLININWFNVDQVNFKHILKYIDLCNKGVL